MMKKFKDRMIQVPTTLLCDCCGREATIDGSDFEAQAFVSLNFVGGYNSIFGDGTQVCLDICQYCLNEKLGAWLKTSKP